MKKHSAIILSLLLLPAFLLSCGEEAAPSSSETEPSESTQSIYEEVYQVPENTVFVNEKNVIRLRRKGSSLISAAKMKVDIWATQW